MVMTKMILPSLVPSALFAEGMLDEHTLIPATVVASACGLCWYLSGRFTKIEADIHVLKSDSKAAREWREAHPQYQKDSNLKNKNKHEY